MPRVNFDVAFAALVGEIPINEVEPEMNIDFSYDLNDHYPREQLIADNYNTGMVEKIIDHYPAVATRNRSWIRVEGPGFYSWPTLSRRTGRNYVFFNKPGKYSLANIYKHLSDNPFENGVRSKKIRKKENKYGGYTHALTSIFAYPAKNIGNLSRTKVWKSIESDLTTFYKGKSPDYIDAIPDNLAINDDGPDIYLLGGRYLPIVTNDYLGDLLAIRADGRPWRLTRLNKFSRTGLLSILPSVIKEYGKDILVSGFAFDIETNSFVVSEEITNYISMKIQSNIRSWNHYGDIVHRFAEPRPNEAEFSAKINQHFVDAGFPSIKAISVKEEEVYLNYSPYDYSDESEGNWGRSISRYVDGFSCIITHNDATIIRRGQIYIRNSDDGTGFTMVSSAWCQRISNWSKFKEDVVDQQYDIWPIVDWITGPFAEMNGINFNEAPAIFMGQNKKVSKSKKRNAIKNLRERLNMERNR